MQAAYPSLHLAITAPNGQYFDHVVVIMMENEGLQNICGGNPPPCSPSAAPNLAGFANTYTIAQSYTSVFTPLTSFPNYIGSVAGSTFACTGGGCGGPLNQKSIVDSLEANGLSWKAYMENYPVASGCATNSIGLYDNIHNPFIWFSNILNSTSRCAKIVNANPSPCNNDCGLLNDLNSLSAPNYMWLTPNDCNNMHGATGCAASISTGDGYLGSLVPAILSSTAFSSQRSALFITFDEGTGFCPVTGGNADCLYASWIGPEAKKGFVYPSTLGLSHFSMLATIEQNWNLPRLQTGDGNANLMSSGLVASPSTESATINVTPPNGEVGVTVSFTVTINNAPVGQAQTFSMTFGDGSSPFIFGTYTPTTNSIVLFAGHTYLSAGTFTASLSGVIGSTTVLSQLSAPIMVTNPTPTMAVSFKYLPPSPQVGTSVLFNGTATCGSCVQPYTFFWQFGDNFSDFGQVVIHAYAKFGAFVVTLAVCDNGQPTCGTAQQTISIPAPICTQTNTCIQAAITWSPANPIAGQVINFALQINGGVQPFTVNWALGDGFSIGGTQPSHVYVNSGTYLVTVTITDSGNNKATVQDSITVQGVPPCTSCGTSPSLITLFLNGLAAIGGFFVGSPLFVFGFSFIVAGVVLVAMPRKAPK